MATVIANYHPEPQITDFLKTVRAEKADLPDLPTTTIPSAHVFWLGIAGYYFFKSKKWLGWIMAPFLVASAAGTVLLAQHYLLDVIASLLIVALVVKITSLLEIQ
jgi:membrane-associated phospholipid phosphatase